MTKLYQLSYRTLICLFTVLKGDTIQLNKPRFQLLVITKLTGVQAGPGVVGTTGFLSALVEAVFQSLEQKLER